MSELIDSILFEAFQFKAEEQNYVIDNNTLKAQGLEDKKTEKSIVKTKTLWYNLFSLDNMVCQFRKTY